IADNVLSRISRITQFFEQPYCGLTRVQFGLPYRGIELDSLKTYLDEIPFRNCTFLESSDVESKQLLESVAVFVRDFHIRSGEQRIVVESLSRAQSPPHRILELHFSSGQG